MLFKQAAGGAGGANPRGGNGRLILGVLLALPAIGILALLGQSKRLPKIW